MSCISQLRQQFLLAIILLLMCNLSYICKAEDYRISSEGGASNKSDVSYNILMLTPFSSPSHMVTFMPVIVALLDRGHKVTMLHNNYKFHHKPHENLTMLHHEMEHLLVEKINVFTISKNIFEMFKFLPNLLWKMSRDFYKDPTVIQLYKRKDTFDLVVLDGHMNEFALPFTYKKTFIYLSLVINDPVRNAQFGNLLNPAHTSNPYHHMPHGMGLINRAVNLIMSIGSPLLMEIVYIPEKYQIYQQFPELPSIWSMSNNHSLMFTMSHFSVDKAVPQVQGQIDITSIHCQEGQPLPQDLEEFLSSDVPVVLINFGTVACHNLPMEYKEMFLAAFSRLPYKFLAKFGDNNDGFPSNVLSKKSLPQQDLLAHPNLKAYISHGGLHGTVESICHATPTLTVPVMIDQVQKGQRLHTLGVGITHPWKELNTKIIEDSLRELITNSSYQEKVSARRRMLRDQLTTPKQRVVYWTEYVIRHQGAPFLIPEERNMSWIAILHIDVMILFIVIAFIVYWVVRILIWTLKYIFRINKERRARNKADKKVPLKKFKHN